MPSALPAGDPVPADGALPEPPSAGLGDRPFGFYVHVPFCTVRCGYCDFNTYTAEELGGRTARGVADDVRRRRRSRRSGWPAGCWATATCPVSTVFFGGGTPTLLPPADLARCSRRSATSSGWPRAPRSPPRPTRTASTRPTSSGCARAASTGSRSACSPRSTHVLADPGPHARPARVPAGRRWAPRAAGFEQVSLDLIYGTPGESARRLGDLARRRARLRARPRLGVLPDRRGRHRAGPAGPPRRAADARRRRPRRQVRAGRRAARGGRPGLVRGVQLGPRRRGPLPAQPALLDRRRLVGRRPRRALATSAACAGGTSSTPRRTPTGWPPASARRTPGRCSTPRRRRVERVLLELRLRDGLPTDVLDADGRAAVPELVERGLLASQRRRPAGAHPRGRLLADAVVRDLLP